MDIQISDLNGVTVIKPQAQTLDIGNAVEMRQKLTTVLETIDSHVHFDLGSVQTIDSSGIGLLIRFWQAIQDKNIDMKISNCNAKVLESLKVAHLNKQIEII